MCLICCYKEQSVYLAASNRRRVEKFPKFNRENLISTNRHASVWRQRREVFILVLTSLANVRPKSHWVKSCCGNLAFEFACFLSFIIVWLCTIFWFMMKKSCMVSKHSLSSLFTKYHQYIKIYKFSGDCLLAAREKERKHLGLLGPD